MQSDEGLPHGDHWGGIAAGWDIGYVVGVNMDRKQNRLSTIIPTPNSASFRAVVLASVLIITTGFHA